MRDSLAFVLGRTRSRLNAVIALHRAFAWAAPAAVASGLLVASTRALGLGLDAGGYALWAALSLAGAAAGAFASRSSFLDEAGTARWLDERLDDDELLAAAIACLRRGSEGRFDEALANRAEELLPRAERLKASRRPLAKQGAKALAALAIGAYLIFLSGMTMVSRDGTTARIRAEAGLSAAAKAATAEEALRGGGRAAEFAASLFPGDRRMATLTERALREGRLDDLRELLEKAGLDVDAKLAGSPTESERKKLARDREKLGDAATALALAARSRSAGAGGAAKEGENPGNGDSRGASPPDAGSYAGQGEQGGGSARPPGSLGASPSAAAKASPYADEAGGEAGGKGAAGAEAGGEGQAGKGGKGYGEGSGAAGDWGNIEPLKGKGSLSIAAPKNPNFFELVLPGSDASRPVSGLAASSRKSAEAATSREDLPLEYEDSVRSYYLQLSKGESR
jgi:hypothetical protein